MLPEKFPDGPHEQDRQKEREKIHEAEKELHVAADARRMMYALQIIPAEKTPMQDRLRARREASLAIRRGELTPQPCEVCGAVAVEAHHDDYSKPLDVRWLCFEHHRELHYGRPIRPKPLGSPKEIRVSLPEALVLWLDSEAESIYMTRNAYVRTLLVALSRREIEHPLAAEFARETFVVASGPNGCQP